MYKYIFILGSNPGLSLAEILSLIKVKEYSLYAEALFLEVEEELNVKKIMKSLGGTIKIAKYENFFEYKGLINSLSDLLHEESLKKTRGKFNFALSFYGNVNANYKDLAIKMKNSLRTKAVSSRWVKAQGKNKQVSSASVYHNNLLSENGLDLLIVGTGKGVIVAKTIEVQEFINYSKRDYGRPERDSFSGMIPPKLAKMMLNLGKIKRNETFLDPFCGSGTMINEALLLGVKDIYGFDISQKAVEDTKDNLLWLEKEFSQDISGVHIKKVDVRKISQDLVQNSIDVVCTEPYLGPQRGKIEAGVVKKDLDNLYSEALGELSKVLKKGSRVVMVWPMFFPEKKALYLEPKFSGYKKIKFDALADLGLLNKRNNLYYGREGQRLWREIVVLLKL